GPAPPQLCPLSLHDALPISAATSSVRAREGHIESITVPANPLDVLAQQVVAMVATQEWEVPALLRLVRRASPFAQVSDAVVHARSEEHTSELQSRENLVCRL